MTSHEGPSTAFWNVNLLPSQHTTECPPYLQYAFTDLKDQAILSTPDSYYHRHSWSQVTDLITRNRLDLLQRVPSDLRRYREYCFKIVKEHGSIMSFILIHRLHWTDLKPLSESPFQNPADYKILQNDWPYGIDLRITHLIIWTKSSFPEDPRTEDLTDEARSEIDAFVSEVFMERGGCEREKVRWFRNWNGLKSVHAIEHFHVLLFEAGEGFVRGLTGGDVALGRKTGVV
ncbi:hypothetical protein LTS14_006589 [Recurvomyces mirabilis]|nr:hypothetical protein LTS14_006589 [Recurvomyces mirabilis]